MSPQLLPQPPHPSVEYLRDYQWLLSNLQNLVARYPDRWVAVVGEQVVASAATRGEALRQAEQAHPDAHPVVSLIERHPRVYAG